MQVPRRVPAPRQNTKSRLPNAKNPRTRTRRSHPARRRANATPLFIRFPALCSRAANSCHSDPAKRERDLLFTKDGRESRFLVPSKKRTRLGMTFAGVFPPLRWVEFSTGKTL